MREQRGDSRAEGPSPTSPCGLRRPIWNQPIYKWGCELTQGGSAANMNGVTWGVQDAELLLTLTLNVWLAWPVEGSNLGYWLWFHWAPLTTCDLFQLSCGVVAEVETPWWGDGGEGILPYTSLFLTINNTNNSLQPSLSFIPLRSLLSILQMCRLRFWEAKELGQGHTAARHLVLCCSRRLVLTTGAQASPSGTSPLQRPTPFVFP